MKTQQRTSDRSVVYITKILRTLANLYLGASLLPPLVPPPAPRRLVSKRLRCDATLVKVVCSHLDSLSRMHSTTFNALNAIFYNARRQPFSVRFYVARLVEYSHCTPESFIAALVYITRVQSRMSLCRRNYHRVLGSALVLAIKSSTTEQVYSDDYYAGVIGISAEELRELETKFIRLLNWETKIEPAEFRNFEEILLNSLSR